MIGVAIDPAGSFHKVLIFDFQLRIIEGPFEIDVLRSGLERLRRSIVRASRLRRARHVVIGIEASGALSWHITRELAAKFRHVYLFNPLAVATARKQKLLLGQKTDAIDVAVLADLILRGHGYPARSSEDIYAQLRELTYWRHHKARLVGKLKQQITDRFSKVYPGLTTGSAELKPLISEVTRIGFARGLIEEGITPQEFLRFSPRTIRDRLRKYLGTNRRPAPLRAQEYFRQILFGPEKMARLQISLLQRDWKLLEQVKREKAEVEAEMVHLLRQTPGRWLVGQMRGISEMQIAAYIGALGDPRQFASAKKIFSLAGLCPRQHQSGSTESSVSGVTKAGRMVLRTTLFEMGRSVSMYEPVFRDYRRRLRARGKGFRSAHIAMVNKLNRTLVALMRDQSEYRRGDTASRIGAETRNG